MVLIFNIKINRLVQTKTISNTKLSNIISCMVPPNNLSGCMTYIDGNPEIYHEQRSINTQDSTHIGSDLICNKYQAIKEIH